MCLIRQSAAAGAPLHVVTEPGSSISLLDALARTLDTGAHTSRTDSEAQAIELSGFSCWKSERARRKVEVWNSLILAGLA